MALQIFGISHKTAPIGIRERLAIGEEQLPLALQALTATPGITEAAILSTCNRTELYCEINDSNQRHAEEWIVRFQDLDAQLIASHSYTFRDHSAVLHALNVACGLDSMVLGEPQILGQLKQAYRAAIGHGTAGKTLHKLFQFSFHVAKQVRSETAIGDNPVSVAYAAAKLAEQIHGDLTKKTAVLVGAGETISLVANHLRGRGIQRMIISNRTIERARELAKIVNGETIALENITSVLPEADILVSSTGSREAIITKPMVEQAIIKRARNPIFLVDLAVPRDVEPDVAELEEAYLYSVDDLNQVVSENAKARENAAQQAQLLIERESHNYLQWSQAEQARTVIVDINNQAEDIKQEALNKARKRLQAGDAPEEVLSLLANTLTKRILHQPIKALHSADLGSDEEVARIARLLLGKQ